MASLIISPVTRVVSCTAWPLYPPEKESQLPIEWDAGWASEAVWAL